VAGGLIKEEEDIQSQLRRQKIRPGPLLFQYISSTILPYEVPVEK
jgi:hypothetical protein